MLNALFTIGAAGVYSGEMLWLAVTSALAAQAPAVDSAVAPQRQASAVVRILKGASIRLGEGARGDEVDAVVRKTNVRESDGSAVPALLIEFS